MELTEEDKANTHSAAEFYGPTAPNHHIVLPSPTRVDMTVRAHMQDLCQAHASDVGKGKGPIIWRYDGDDGCVQE